MSERRTIYTQFANSSSADFETNEWTFLMPEKYQIVAGEFALVDKELYDKLIQSITDLHTYCQGLEKEPIFLSNISVILKRLDGTVD